MFTTKLPSTMNNECIHISVPIITWQHIHDCQQESTFVLYNIVVVSKEEDSMTVASSSFKASSVILELDVAWCFMMLKGYIDILYNSDDNTLIVAIINCTLFQITDRHTGVRCSTLLS